MTTVIEARDLRKSYGPIRALDGVSFTVESGRIVGLIGPNGAGKTTALKAILGLTHVEGALRVLDRNPRTERDLLMRDVCFIADVAVLPKWLRVRQALEFVAGVHPRFDRQRAQEFLAKTDIHMTSRVRQLSKGMTQKLGLAACLLSQRELYVLDEPMSGLDPAARARAKELLLKLKSEGRTLLITSHSLADVEEVCDQVTVLHKGTLAYTGTPDGMRERFEESSLERAFLKCIEAHA